MKTMFGCVSAARADCSINGVRAVPARTSRRVSEDALVTATLHILCQRGHRAGASMLETGVMNDCWARLKNDGLLLKSDPRLPSVAGLVAGEAIRGSWWAHPAAHAIFQEL